MEQLFTLYKGRVKGKFLGPTPENPNRHMYYIEGKRKTGATTFLGIKDKSNALVSWNREETLKALLPILDAGKKPSEKEIVAALYAAEESKTRAADLGKLVHTWIENYINHRLAPKKCPMPEMPEDPNVQLGASSFLKWEAEHKVKFLWSEKVVYSLKHDYIGTADFGAVVDGLTCLCDIKTGNGMYNSVRAQTAAYVEADKEENKTKYDGRWAIRIAKETPVQYRERLDLKNRLRTMLGKEPNAIEPYQVFEAMYLDNEKSAQKEDFTAFLAHVELYRWDGKTDFWKLKNR